SMISVARRWPERDPPPPVWGSPAPAASPARLRRSPPGACLRFRRTRPRSRTGARDSPALCVSQAADCEGSPRVASVIQRLGDCALVSRASGGGGGGRVQAL